MTTSAPTTAGFVELPLPQLLAKMSSRDPVPGGGSAAAIAGALAASLTAMVAGLTVDKAGYEAVAEDMKRLGEASAGAVAMLLQAAEYDALAYERVMAAMALPKGTEEEKDARRQAMQDALKDATKAPLVTAKADVEVGHVAVRLLATGNKNAASDAAVAGLLATSAAEGALLNVAINLGSIKDELFVAAITAEANAAWAAAAELRAQLWPAVKAAGLDVPR